jgi:hypothetical protein
MIAYLLSDERRQFIPPKHVQTSFQQMTRWRGGKRVVQQWEFSVQNVFWELEGFTALQLATDSLALDKSGTGVRALRGRYYGEQPLFL